MCCFPQSAKRPDFTHFDCCNSRFRRVRLCGRRDATVHSTKQSVRVEVRMPCMCYRRSPRQRSERQANVRLGGVDAHSTMLPVPGAAAGADTEPAQHAAVSHEIVFASMFQGVLMYVSFGGSWEHSLHDQHALSGSAHHAQHRRNGEWGLHRQQYAATSWLSCV